MVGEQTTILLIGAGAIGTSIATWLAPFVNNLYVLEQPAILAAIEKKGVTAYLQNQPETAQHAFVKTVPSLQHSPAPDIIILCVKNYSLESLARDIASQFGDRALVISLQNGVENQAVLPKYFSRVVYGIIGFNGWLDEPAVACYQKRGPLIFGTVNNQLQDELVITNGIFSKGVETVITEHLMDAALCKMIINLSNSFTTLIGLNFKPLENPALFQKILSELTLEGVKIVKAAGYRECKLGGMPSWRLITASAMLPRFLTRRTFEKNLKKMVISSMAQDVIQHHSANNELDNINGYLLELSKKHDVPAPCNEAIYYLCKQEFARPGFEPVSIDVVAAAIQKQKKSAAAMD